MQIPCHTPALPNQKLWALGRQGVPASSAGDSEAQRLETPVLARTTSRSYRPGSPTPLSRTPSPHPARPGSADAVLTHAGQGQRQGQPGEPGESMGLFPPPGATGAPTCRARGLRAGAFPAAPGAHTPSYQQTPGKGPNIPSRCPPTGGGPEPRSRGAQGCTSPQRDETHHLRLQRRPAGAQHHARRPEAALCEEVWVCFKQSMRVLKKSVVPPMDFFYMQFTH